MPLAPLLTTPGLDPEVFSGCQSILTSDGAIPGVSEVV
jgi:hypothetical protein